LRSTSTPRVQFDTVALSKVIVPTNVQVEGQDEPHKCMVGLRTSRIRSMLRVIDELAQTVEVQGGNSTLLYLGEQRTKRVATLVAQKEILDAKGLCHECGYPLDNSYPHPLKGSLKW
jgi:hypothetical protein